MTPAAVDLTVVIPYYNRADTVPLTLASVAAARGDLVIETVLIDDGSAVPATEALREIAHAPDRILRQANQGLLFARLAGLREARGEFVLFLDSDDLVGPEKFTAQLGAMRAAGAAVSYTDTAQAQLRSSLATLEPRPDEPARDAAGLADFFIAVQPPPHSPIFRTAWLQDAVAHAIFPPSPHYNPVAEIWFYHIAAVRPGAVIKVPGVHTIVGHHGGGRLTNHWEKLGIASLAVMEAFARHCPRTAATQDARRLVGERAFDAWRRLPRGFPRDFQQRLLAIWCAAPRGPRHALGGPFFRALATVFGAKIAGRILRLRNAPYAACRTVTAEEWVKLLRAGAPATQ